MSEAQQVIGRYRVESILGRGAMGIVYRAWDPVDERHVALKTLRADVLAGAERFSIEQRFAREASLGARLEHRNIVCIYNHGSHAGALYLAMELIAGRELRELIEKGPPLGVEGVVEIIAQLLDALAYAHRRGVIHRDIKPSNLLIDDDQRIKLMDFGIAHVAASEVTQTGELLGTPAYMSPEQLQGVPVDERADLFSTGVVLHYLLTQKRPFTGSLATVMQQVLFVDPPPPSEVNPAVPTPFDAVVRRAMSKNREQRYPSAEAFAQALAKALQEARTAGISPAAHHADATVVAGPGFGGAASQTLVLTELDRLLARVGQLIDECLGKRATEKRLSQLRSLIAEGVGLKVMLDRAMAPGGPEPRVAAALVRFRQLLMLSLDATVQLIQSGVPVPGRSAGASRSDWHGLVGLFTQLRLLADDLGLAAETRARAERIAVSLAGIFIAYANELNRHLFGEAEPELMQLAGDFMRLEIIQLALEEIGAEREVATVRTTMLMFASQVMRRANMTIGRFARTGDAAARHGVDRLLGEVEELIVMANRLLERDEGGVFGSIGGDVVGEFVENATQLARVTAAELKDDLVDPGGEEAFNGKVGQLASIYRFATRLPGNSFGDRLARLTGEVHDSAALLVEGVVEQLRRARVSGRAEVQQRAYNHLTVLWELAEEFGWAEIGRAIMREARQDVVGA